VSVAESVGRRAGHGHAFLAGDDDARLGDLWRGLADPGIAAVLCARGGHGSVRLLPGLVAHVAAGSPPPTVLLGSSDVTALHAALAGTPSVTRLLGPMVATAALGDAVTVASLRADLLGAGAGPLAGTPLAGGRATGIAEGGTLSLLTTLLGTPFAASVHSPGTGRLLLLEDVGEEPYRLDRMLTQLGQGGGLAGLAGVALGTFERCGDPAAVRRVLLGHLAPLGVPVVAGLPFSHGRPHRAIRLGAPHVLDGDAGTLRRA
jgi:muramoyltetrapeptide carboxypeptidase